MKKSMFLILFSAATATYASEKAQGVPCTHGSVMQAADGAYVQKMTLEGCSLRCLESKCVIVTPSKQISCAAKESAALFHMLQAAQERQQAERQKKANIPSER